MLLDLLAPWEAASADFALPPCCEEMFSGLMALLTLFDRLADDDADVMLENMARREVGPLMLLKVALEENCPGGFVLDCMEAASLPRLIQGCRSAASGLSLLSGSQCRHFVKKSRNRSSLQFNAELNVFVLGLLLLPLLLTTGRGAPVESKKSFFRELFSMR